MSYKFGSVRPFVHSQHRIPELTHQFLSHFLHEASLILTRQIGSAQRVPKNDTKSGN